MIRDTPSQAIRIAGAALRVVVAFALMSLIFDSWARLYHQAAPRSAYFALRDAYFEPSGIWFRLDRDVSRTIVVTVTTELQGVTDPTLQPCAGTRVIPVEEERQVVRMGLARILPGCDWRNIPDGIYAVSTRWEYLAFGQYRKAQEITTRNALVIKGGVIVGVEPVIESDLPPIR